MEAFRVVVKVLNKTFEKLSIDLRLVSDIAYLTHLVLKSFYSQPFFDEATSDRENETEDIPFREFGYQSVQELLLDHPNLEVAGNQRGELAFKSKSVLLHSPLLAVNEKSTIAGFVHCVWSLSLDST